MKKYKYSRKEIAKWMKNWELFIEPRRLVAFKKLIKDLLSTLPQKKKIVKHAGVYHYSDCDFLSEDWGVCRCPKDLKPKHKEKKECKHNWVEAGEEMFVCGGKDLAKGCFYCSKCLKLKPSPSLPEKIEKIETEGFYAEEGDKFGIDIGCREKINEVTEALNKLIIK